MDDRARRAAEARAHREEKAFVSQEMERIDQAARSLRRAIFLSPGDERSVIITGVVATLEQVTENLRRRI